MQEPQQQQQRQPEPRAQQPEPQEPRPVAVVTGATGGMGFEIATELAASHRVHALGRNPEQLTALAQIPGIEAHALELTEYAAVRAWAERLERVDVLVNAAAIAVNHSVASATAAAWLEQLAVNVTAPAQLTGALLPQLRRAAGTVVFIGSGASTKPVAGSVIYAATKHALKAVADSLRIEEEPHRLRVVTVAPGQTDTAMLRGLIPAAEYTAERYIQPRSIAAAVRYIVDAPADIHITDVVARPRQEIKRL